MPVQSTSGAASLGGAVVLLWWLTPCFAQAPSPRQVSAVDAARIYADACAPCHGVAGDGRGPAARLLGAPQPRDFTRGAYKFRSTPTGSLPTDEDLYRAISRGVPGTWMPAWESLLAPSERWALVQYLKAFSALFDEETPDPPLAVPPPPPAGPELVAEGRYIYAVLRCAQCHGLRGRGDGPSAKELTDDWGAPIKAYDFTRGTYRNGAAPPDLYRTLVTGLNGTPMPALEPDAVAFPGGPDADVVPLQRELPPDEVRTVGAYLAGQPSAAELQQMSPDGRKQLVERRLWALVHYVRSLTRPRGLVDRLFRGNPDLESEADRP